MSMFANLLGGSLGGMVLKTFMNSDMIGVARGIVPASPIVYKAADLMVTLSENPQALETIKMMALQFAEEKGYNQDKINAYLPLLSSAVGVSLESEDPLMDTILGIAKNIVAGNVPELDIAGHSCPNCDFYFVSME